MISRSFPEEPSPFFTRVPFFAYLEPEERQEILKTRLAYLASCMAYLNTMQEMSQKEACAPILGSTSYAQRVLALHTRCMQEEYQWVADWLEEMQASASSSHAACAHDGTEARSVLLS